MAYEPTNWKSGDVVTSAKLNKLEQGVANAGGLIVGMDTTNMTLDKTYREIADAVPTGIVLLPVETAEDDYAISILAEHGTWVDGAHAGEKYVMFVNIAENVTVIAYAPTENDYPVFDMV